MIGVGRLSSSGVDVRATYFGHDDPVSSSNPIPAGTLQILSEPNIGLWGYAADVQPLANAPASSEASMFVRLSNTNGVFTATAFGGNDNDTDRKYNASGSPVYTDFDPNTITIYTGPNGVTPTGWRIVYGPTSNPTQFDTGWQTSGNAITSVSSTINQVNSEGSATTAGTRVIGDGSNMP